MSDSPIFTCASEAAKFVADEALLFNDDAPFRAAIEQHDQRLVVVTGDNASGKSLFIRTVAGFLVQEDVLPVSVSIRERTGAGADDNAGMRRVMMFGDEDQQSTGATTVSVIDRALANLERPSGSMLIVDEPELGLSDEYSRALGEYLGRRMADIPAECLGVTVVTHSRAVVQGLLDSGRQLPPTHVALGAGEAVAPGLQQWLEAREHRSVEDLLELSEAARQRRRQVLDILS